MFSRCHQLLEAMQIKIAEHFYFNRIQTLSSLDCTFVIVCDRSLEQRESKYDLNTARKLLAASTYIWCEQEWT